MDVMKPVLEMLDKIIKDVEQALAPKSAEQGTPMADRSLPTNSDTSTKTQQQKKKKKEKKPKQPTPPAIDLVRSQFLQCDLRVGRVTEVSNHPKSEVLYVLKVRYSDEELRTICAGLRNYIPEEELKDRMVVTICNLKPRPLRGILSEGMVLAGSVKSDEGMKDEVVILAAPAAAEDGSVVIAEGIDEERTVTEGKFVSGKTWDKIVPRLSVKDGIACYDSKPLRTAAGVITCQLPDGVEIH